MGEADRFAQPGLYLPDVPVFGHQAKRDTVGESRQNGPRHAGLGGNRWSPGRRISKSQPSVRQLLFRTAE